jgi:Spy/CpxP family protein refolding chaperone
MNKHLVMLLAVALVWTTNAFAQKKGAAGKGNGAAAGQQQQRRIKTIFDYKPELGLTDAQETQIKDALKKLAAYLKECQTRIVKNLREVKTLRDQEADIEKIKPFLKSNADIQVEMGVADIQASRQINRILKPEQLTKWRDIQKKSAAAAAPAPEGPPASAGTPE